MKTSAEEKQNEIDKKYQWNLEDIYKSEADLNHDLELFKKELKQIDSCKERITKSGNDLYECLTLVYKLKVQLEKLAAYGHLSFSLDQSSIKNQELRDTMNALEVQFYEKISFVVPMLIALDTKKLEKFQTDELKLDLYKTYFGLLLKNKAHVLDAAQEQLLASAFSVNSSLMNAYTNLKTNDIKLPKIKDEKGEEVALTDSSYQSLYRISPDRRVREEAHKGYFGALFASKNTFSSIYDGLINFRIFQAKARHYRDALEASTMGNFKYIDSNIARNLIKTVSKNLDPLHHYMDIKRKELGLKKLQAWDVYAPSHNKKPTKVPYEEARKTVLDAVRVLGDDYTRVMETAFNERWIDVYPTKAKYSGGFNTGVYTVHPFILLNYQDTLRDMEVLAHELGHAAHSYFSNKNQPYIYSDYTIFVAEIASITNENILYRYLLDHEKDSQKKREILYQVLEGMQSTLFRQTMFAEFELGAHEMAERNESLNAESLGKLWISIQQKYYGNKVELDDLSHIYWAYIPHFFQSDFYVYQYATSMCAAIVLGERLYNNDEDLRKKYLNFLKQGSRKNSIELIQNLGIDLSQPEPIIQAIKTFEKLLKDYEGMVKNQNVVS